jgi:hypothetical protein
MWCLGVDTIIEARAALGPPAAIIAGMRTTASNSFLRFDGGSGDAEPECDRDKHANAESGSE